MLLLEAFMWDLKGPNSDFGDLGKEKYGFVLGCGRLGDKLVVVIVKL